MNTAKFKKEFKKANLSQNEFSKQSGVNVSAINRLLGGCSLNLTIKTILKLEKQLNLEKGTLL